MRLHLLLTAAALAGCYSSYTPEHVMVDVTNEFGACVLKLVASRGENVAFSPYGLVSVALVLYEGSNGPSAAELHNALRLPWDTQLTRVGFRDLHRYLKSYFTNDGFLRGLVLSKPNVVLHRNYTRQLEFYGFDLRSEPPKVAPPTTERRPPATERPTTYVPVSTVTPPRTTGKRPETTTEKVDTTTEKADSTTEKAETTKKPETTEQPETEARSTTVSEESTTAAPEGKDMEVEIAGQTTMTQSETTLPATSPSSAETTTASSTEAAPTAAATTVKHTPAPDAILPDDGTTTVDVSKVETTVSMTVSSATSPTVPPSTVTQLVEVATTQPPATTVVLVAEEVPVITTEVPTVVVEAATVPTTVVTVEAATVPTTVVTTEVPTVATTIVEATLSVTEAAVDNAAGESQVVTRKERALYSRGYGTVEHRQGAENWMPPYQDLRWRSGGGPQDNWFFTPSGGERVPVITYTAYLPFAYISEIAATALQLPLDDPRYYMVILLPEDRNGLGKLLYAIQWCSVRGIVDQLKITAIYAVVPSFTVVKHINLVPALIKLGVTRIFDPARADLSAMSPEPAVYVKTIEQVVTVSLRKYFANHKWFDATPGDVEQHFIANHPFIYFVLDRETQVTLMTGTIVNPLAHSQ